jgi:non-ribosomal peptide synthetase component F
MRGPELRQLLETWNDTSSAYERERSAQELFEAQVERTPEDIAVEFEGRYLTYRELNRRANQLAHHLRGRGVGPDVLVAIYLDRCPEMVVALLASLKAGGAYVPLDPAYPAERLRFMMDDSGASVLLTQHRLREAFPVQGARIIELDRLPPEIERMPEDDPESGVRPDDLAYVIYTSGSTGTPKGAMIAHRGLVNYLSWCTTAYAVAQGNGAPVHSSIGFDLTVTSLFAPLMVGQRVTLLPEGVALESLGSALRSTGGFSLVKITPSHLELLARELAADQDGPAAAQEAWREGLAVEGLSFFQAQGFNGSRARSTSWTRAFVIGGEELTAEGLSFFREHAREIRLINEYGPTETVVGCCVYEVPPDIQPGPVPIGQPIANTRLYVLDRHLRPVPVGVPGELYIGGDGVARGYLHRPGLTAERFIPDPFSVTPGARLYKTGDLARWSPGGQLEFRGRVDHQVKIRGYRVELGEIEAALAQHPAVREAVVVVREDAPEDQRLVAYWTAQGPDLPGAGELRGHLSLRLPEYMVPSAFVALSEMPLTKNGKVNRRALPAPDRSRNGAGGELAAPRNPIEQALSEIWAQVLGVERIGVTDHFFELGGHSLLATQVVSRVRDAFGVSLLLRQVFASPVLADLAVVVMRSIAEAAADEDLELVLAELSNIESMPDELT